MRQEAKGKSEEGSSSWGHSGCSSEDALSLLREQESLFGRLEALASRQRPLVAAEGMEPLLSLLADRKRLLDEMIQVATRLEPILQGWPRFRERLTPAEQVEADRLLALSHDRRRRLRESDERDARILAVRRKGVAEKLQASYSGGEAIAAYQAPVHGTVRPHEWNET